MTKARASVERRKIAFIGASYLFVPSTVKDMLLNGSFEDSEVVLYDIDREPSKIVLDVTRRMAAQRGSLMKISVARTRREALKGADYVVTSLLVGGLDMAEKEDRICRKHGIRHTVGDTIGPMCAARVLRQAPLLLDIARDMEKLCPGTPLLSPTNPMASLVTAVTRYSDVECLGICHGTSFIRNRIAQAYLADPLDVEMNLVGVNHFAMVDRVSIKGKEKQLKAVMRKVAEMNEKALVDSAGVKAKIDNGIRFGARVGYLPNNDDHHFIEFFPWFLGPQAFDGKGQNRYGLEGSILNVPRRRANKKALRKQFINWAHKLDEIPEMDVYGGEHIQDIIMGLEGRRKLMTLKDMQLTVRNGSSVPNMPAGAALELSVRLGRSGVRPVKNPPLDMFRWGVMSRLVAINELATRAAIEKDRHAFIQALHLDPLVHHFDTLPQLAEDLWEVNKPHMKPKR